MELSTQTLKRLPTIKHSLLTGLTTQQIGDKLGVTEKTIDRDLKAFRQSGEFEAWLKEEWMRLHHIIIKQNPTEAYKQITRLIGQTITRRIEARTEIEKTVTTKHEININVYNDDEKSILDKAAQLLDRKSKRESTSLH